MLRLSGEKRTEEQERENDERLVKEWVEKINRVKEDNYKPLLHQVFNRLRVNAEEKGLDTIASKIKPPKNHSKFVEKLENAHLLSLNINCFDDEKDKTDEVEKVEVDKEVFSEFERFMQSYFNLIKRYKANHPTIKKIMEIRGLEDNDEAYKRIRKHFDNDLNMIIDFHSEISENQIEAYFAKIFHAYKGKVTSESSMAAEKLSVVREKVLMQVLGKKNPARSTELHLDKLPKNPYL